MPFLLLAHLQVITAFEVIKGTQGGQIGHNKLTALKANSNFFRSELIKVPTLISFTQLN